MDLSAFSQEEQENKLCCEYTNSYEKVLTNLREAMLGGEWNYKEFIHDMKILDQEILDLSPPSSKFEKKYSKKFAFDQ